ncbi:unnamed protein product, partial [Ectocarpus sp. 4 AP-2014]
MSSRRSKSVFCRRRCRKYSSSRHRQSPKVVEALWSFGRRPPPVEIRAQPERARVESVKPRPRRGRAEDCTEE